MSVETVNGCDVTIIRNPFDVEWVREQLGAGICPLVEYTGKWDIASFVYFAKYDDEAEIPTYSNIFCPREKRYIIGVHNSELPHTVTILPALPRNPKPEDIRLIHRYLAEGIRPFAVAQTPKGLPLGSWCGLGVLEAVEASRDMEVKYAFNNSDEEIEIAIL